MSLIRIVETNKSGYRMNEKKIYLQLDTEQTPVEIAQTKKF